MNVPRETGFRPLVLASLSCSAAWLLAVLLFAFSVTDQDSKIVLCVTLVLLSGAGTLFGVSAWLGRSAYARLACGVNMTLGVLSVLAAVAVLS